MVETNDLPLLSLLTITLLLLLEPCLTNANYIQDHTPKIPKIPKKSTCAQNNQTDLKFHFLARHNIARKKANIRIPNLVWSKKVANYSRWYAEQRRWDCKLIHSHGEYGENLFWGSGNCWTVDKIMQAWVIERNDYDYKTNTCRKMCGHYTQIVWKKTKRLGCAVVMCAGDLGTLAVCNYDPPGNYVGMWPY